MLLEEVTLMPKTFDITESMQRHYPALKDLMTEKEFLHHLVVHEGLEMSETSLRDYRHRDKKFAYIRKGHQIYYPLHVNKQIIREMKDERDDWIGDIND
jgi:hypothetical protein